MSYHLKTKAIEAIENHYKKYFTMAGAKDSGLVMHEMVSDDMHIDIEHFLPSEQFPYHIFATVGMSGYTMKGVPYKNIELIMFLPADWKTEKEDLLNSTEQWYWPIRMLKNAARLPYLCNTVLSIGHTFSLDENNKPFNQCTEMCAGFINFPTWLDFGVFELNYGNLFSKKKVNFLCLTAINEKELKLLYQIGARKFTEEVLVKDGKDDLLVRNKR